MGDYRYWHERLSYFAFFAPLRCELATYTSWGETRSGSAPTTFGYTGQREEDALGILYYNARWYDPALGRFLSADTLVPGMGNPLAWDRYAYSFNNSINNVDPTGHSPKYLFGGGDSGMPLASYEVYVNPGDFSTAVLMALTTKVRDIANSLTKVTGTDSMTSFKEAFGNVGIEKMSENDCDCAADVWLDPDEKRYEVRVYKPTWAANHSDLFVHELGHVYYNLHNKAFTPMGYALRREDYGNAENGYHGFSGGKYSGQYAVVNLNYSTEKFADMFLGWTYNRWTFGAPEHPGEARKDWMNVNMANSLFGGSYDE